MKKLEEDEIEERMKDLYAEFADEDRDLAEADMDDLIKNLTLEELLEGVTEGNRHDEIDTGPPVGKEVW